MNPLAEAIRQTGSKVRKVRIDDTLHILIAPPESTEAKKFEAKITAALNRGQTVVEGDTSRWIECIPVMDFTKKASDRYTWHKDGNRIKNQRILFTKISNSGGMLVTEKQLGFVWRSFLAE
jgi:hypothetical protein